MKMKLRMGVVLFVVLSLIALAGIAGAAPGDVLYYTTFSEDDFSWDDWDTAWYINGKDSEPDRSPLGKVFKIENGTLTLDLLQGEIPVDGWGQFMLLKRGYEWTDYRVEVELSIPVEVPWDPNGIGLSTVLVRGDKYAENWDMVHVYSGEGQFLWWQAIDGAQKNHAWFDLFWTVGMAVNYDLYKMVVEVKGDRLTVWIDDVLVEDGSKAPLSLEKGTVGFRAYLGQWFTVHSLKVIEL